MVRVNGLRILPFLLIFLSGASTETPVHENRIVYGGIKTGLRIEHFNSMFPGFTEFAAGSIYELEGRSATDFSIQTKRPTGLDLFDVYVRRIPASILRPPKPLECDSVQEGTFLKYPAAVNGKTKMVLYSYDYLVCADSGDISPSRLLEKYIEKYGNYDRKDYDRNQHIYLNTKNRYEVRVKPVSSGDKKAGLVITVTDSLVFKNVYGAWRAYVRELEKKAQEKL